MKNEKKLILWVNVWVIVGYYRHIHRHRIFYRSRKFYFQKV